MKTHSRWFRRGVTLLALLAFGYMVGREGLEQLWTAVRGLSPGTVLLAMAAYAAGQAFNALRWYALLRGRGLAFSYLDALRIYWAGNFSGLLLSSHLGGDGYRALAAYARLGRKEPALTSVFLDRMVNLASMVLLLPVALGILGPLWALRLPPSGWLPLAAVWVSALAGLRQAWQHWRTHPRALLWAFLAAWPSNLVTMFGTYWVARSLGIPARYHHIVAAQTATYWLSLGGWAGVRELGYLMVYPLFGATATQAGVLALVTRGLQWLVALPGALWISAYLPWSNGLTSQTLPEEEEPPLL